MEFKQDKDCTVDKIGEGILWLAGLMITAITGFFLGLLRYFFGRLSKAENEIAKVKTEVTDLEKVMSIQQTQNTREHDKLEKNTAEKIGAVGKSLGKSLDVMREIQTDMVKDIKDILKSKPE